MTFLAEPLALVAWPELPPLVMKRKEAHISISTLAAATRAATKVAPLLISPTTWPVGLELEVELHAAKAAGVRVMPPTIRPPAKPLAICAFPNLPFLEDHEAY